MNFLTLSSGAFLSPINLKNVRSFPSNMILKVTLNFCLFGCLRPENNVSKIQYNFISQQKIVSSEIKMNVK